MKNIGKSIFLLLGIFILCIFSQVAFAQEKVQPKKEVQKAQTLKKGDKIRSTGSKRTLLEKNVKPIQRPAVKQNSKPSAQRPTARPTNKIKPQTRPIPSNKANIKRPAPNNNKLRPAENRPRPAIQNKTATEGRLKGIRQGTAVAKTRAMSAQNQQAMRSGHSKLKGMREKLNAAKQKVAKEKAANPNSAEVKAKEARILQAEAKIKAMEQEMSRQRSTITRITQQ